ncbi:MAG: hypothetical protein HRU26_11035 [Psychroserpens sp.]|nr:hypothetical protein [Psychroserpens sp.]
MENPFRDIDKPLQSVPPELKSKVMNDIDTAKLLMELSELFSYNLGDVIETVISKRDQNK